eukprot:scaffold3159_cov393-Prasinococcus_capsulatus_cf.AAC.13
MKATVINTPPIVVKVKEATNSDQWGPHGTTMQEVTCTYQHPSCVSRELVQMCTLATRIVVAANDPEEFNLIMETLWQRLDEVGPRSWCSTTVACSQAKVLQGLDAAGVHVHSRNTARGGCCPTALLQGLLTHKPVRAVYLRPSPQHDDCIQYCDSLASWVLDEGFSAELPVHQSGQRSRRRSQRTCQGTETGRTGAERSALGRRASEGSGCLGM